ncbi:MAG TPA: MaoC family dehydratase N-terminal domain-containing protein [Pseudonocardia sp.]|nr:MaoC family dehydratase N-terminal domain-containing protein [Pseudonocardia sp.]
MAEPFEMRIELGKVREFARATGSRHPEHTNAEGAVSPATFLMSSAFWQTAASSAWPRDRDMRRVLHAEQEFSFPKGPPGVGAVLTGQSRIADTVTKAGRRGGELVFTTLVTEYRDESGELVAEVRQTLVETSKATGADK